MWGGRGGRGACACGGGGGGGGVILGEVKARPKDIISFSLDYISKSKVQTSNPSSSPISLDTPARPADFTAKVAQFTMLALKAQVSNQELSSFSAFSTTPAAVSISFLCCLLTNGLQVESLARRKQSTNIARRL